MDTNNLSLEKSDLKTCTNLENESSTISSESLDTQKTFNGVEISKLTKTQMKKYKKLLKWQEVKKEKRAKEKEKAKEKRKYAKLHELDTGPSRKELKRKKNGNESL